MDCSEIDAANDQVLYSEAGASGLLFFVPTEQRPTRHEGFICNAIPFYSYTNMYVLYRSKNVILSII
jgi:hypothetical protein